MRRRPALALLAGALARGAGAAPGAPPATPEAADPPALGVSQRPLRFPADHGAHPDTRTEWWYVTGWLREARREGGPALPAADAPPQYGFQITFFRSRTGLAADNPSRFAARQLVFAHAALTDLRAGRQAHAQRLARAGFGLAEVPRAAGEQRAALGDWSLVRTAATDAGAPTALALHAGDAGFSFALELAGTQPRLLEGDAGWSQKGPSADDASHYYSEPQLDVRGRAATAGGVHAVTGRAWLDHEWSDAYLPASAVGWDWIGMNLLDGGALMAFRMRRADGSALWAGGTWRDAAGQTRTLGPGDLAFTPRRTWTSPRTRGRWPVELAIATPLGSFVVAALLDDQELDSRGSVGSVYWEGVAALRRADGSTAGWGYLELTGYAGRQAM